MKKIYLLLVILFLAITSFAQRFTLAELIQLNSYNWDDFDSYVITKGYEYTKTHLLEFVEARTYSYTQDENNEPNFIEKTVSKTGSKKLVSFQTLHKDVYLSLKDQLKESKFIYIDSKTNSNSITLNYKKDDTEALLSQFQITDLNNVKFTLYEIAVKTN